MRIDQISVFLENKQGQLAEVMRGLAEGAVNIRALSLADTERFGILRLIVDNCEVALRVLKSLGVTVNLSEVVAVEVPDRAGGLSSVLGALEGHAVNLEYMYAVVQGRNDKAVLIMKLDDLDSAMAAFAHAGVHLIGGAEISGP